MFGAIVNGSMQLNEFGQIVANGWQWLSAQYPCVELDKWVVMPNHLHGILVLTDTPRRGGKPAARYATRTAPTTHDTTQPTSIDASKPKPLGRLIGAFKTISTKEINQVRNTPGIPIWQRNYYEHIIRHKEALQTIRHYIQTNPQSWNLDRLHPDNPSKW
jgi:putative transposase